MKDQLTKPQKQAMAHVTEYAQSRMADAQTIIREILQMSNLSWETYEAAIARIKAHAKVGVHFHPDRPIKDGKCVAESLLEQGVYRSQFETGISSGSVSAYAGGARDRWEEQLFGGAYQQEGVAISERPKYGALDLMQHADGPAPRFGSCYFLLAPIVSQRCTFTYGGSQDNPPEKGTYDAFDDIAAALLKEIFLRDGALGEPDLTPRMLIDRLLTQLAQPFPNPSNRLPSRNLNHFIEAQVHGDILLQDDVEMLVADPSFRGAETGRLLEELCTKYAIELQWHSGFAMKEAEVPADFRGPTMPSLAQRIARHGCIDASVIGEAVRDLSRNPKPWADRGDYATVLQELKLMWHVLVRFGDNII
jgi:hypothetical protein